MADIEGLVAIEYSLGVVQVGFHRAVEVDGEIQVGRSELLCTC